MLVYLSELPPILLLGSSSRSLLIRSHDLLYSWPTNNPIPPSTHSLTTRNHISITTDKKPLHQGDIVNIHQRELIPSHVVLTS